MQVIQWRPHEGVKSNNSRAMAGQRPQTATLWLSSEKQLFRALKMIKEIFAFYYIFDVSCNCSCKYQSSVMSSDYIVAERARNADWQVTGTIQNCNDNECLAGKMEVKISMEHKFRALFGVITVTCTFASAKMASKKRLKAILLSY